MDSISTLPAPDTKVLGALTIVAQITMDGGYSINTFTGPDREANLCFTTPDRDTFRLAYRVIGEGGLNGVRPDGIRAALTDALTAELHAMQRRRDTPSRARVDHLNALLDVIDPISDEALTALTAQVGGALAEVAAEISQPRAKSFADFKRMHAERIEQDRAERATRKAVA